MDAFVTLLVVTLTTVAAVPALQSLTRQTKLTGGNVAVISQYPSTASLLYAADGANYQPACVGTILTTKSIVTAAHCVQGDPASKWRARVGSSWSNSGGSVFSLYTILVHPNFNVRTMDSDIAVLKTTTAMVLSNLVKPASIAGANYVLADNQVVWGVGFGASAAGSSEQLRHIQIWSYNQSTCASRYATLGSNVTANMLCAGVVTSTAVCVGDSGGPLFHNNVFVGLYSWGFSCASAQFPGVNTRVSRFTTWLQNNV